MSSKPRYVFDASTLVSALLFEQSKPGRAFRRAIERGMVLLSPSTLEELGAVIGREKFDRYVTDAERDEFLDALVDRALFVEPSEMVRASRDPKDDKYLELAVSGGAQCIVSSDEDLLVLHTFRGIAIVTPAAFLDVIQSDQPRPGP